MLAKLDRYATLARERQKRRPVLIELPTPARARTTCTARRESTFAPHRESHLHARR